MSLTDKRSPDIASVHKLKVALAGVRKRRQFLRVLHQSSLLAVVVVTAFLALSFLSLRLPEQFLLQVLMFAVFGAISVFALWRYLAALRRLREDDRQLAGYVESRLPDLEQRLLTSLEFSADSDSASQKGVSRQFLQQLWDDADVHLHAQQQQLSRISDSRIPLTSFAIASGSGLLLVVLLVSSDALLRAGSQLLWPFSNMPEVTATPVIEESAEPAELVLSVEPGDIRMQRGRAATIQVRVENAVPDDVRLRMRSDQLNWYDVNMQRDGAGSDGAAFSYYMPTVTEDLVYYVSVDSDGEQRSREYRITLYDLPQAEQIDVAYQFPSYTGLENYEETDSGDFVVPEGTRLDLNIAFNKAVQQAQMVFDDESSLPVTVDGQSGRISLTVDQDRVYRIVATDFDRQQTEDADQYYIRAIPDEVPSLALLSPGRDQNVMPLEEVVLQIEASDDYGLTDFTLHYSVIGADEVSVDFLPETNIRNVTGDQMIYMEDLAVSPGDFVSYYLTVADNNELRGPQEVVSDIYFLQVVPTDQEFRRASGGGQQGGGGGGGNNESSALVTLQKDIIAATWRLRQQQLNMDQQQFEDDVAVVADSQRDAMDRARMSIDRLSERINFADDSYGNAVTYLQRAIEQMQSAADDLDQLALTQAMQPEQQALQFVLRAEAEINRTDVNFQRQAGGGGGGGGQQEREDLRELFEMEMGQNENRYETPRQAQQGGGQNAEENSRLEELARRQEGLTRAQRNLARRMDQMDEEQRRRELERLRREQEQLLNDVAQLQQQMSRRQQMSQSAQSAQAGGGQSQNEQLQRALEQMQEAAQAPTPAQAAARSQRALESLREQQRTLAQQPDNSPDQLAQNLAQRGQQLLQQQQQLQQALEDLNRQQGLGQTRQAAAENEQLQELVNQQQRNRQELEEIERMLRAVVARADTDEQQLLSQAQAASRALRPVREQMDTSNRVLRNGMVNLALDIENDVNQALTELNNNLQALGSGTQLAQQSANADPISQAAADASALRQQLEALQQQIEQRQGEPGGDQSGTESIAQLRERLQQSQQLAQQLSEQLQQAGQQQSGEAGQQQGRAAGQPAQRGQAGQQANRGARAAGGQETRQGLGGIPEQGEAALWGNARSISSEITQQSLEAFMNQPELLRGLLQPLIELESDLRARAELARITQRLYTVSEEDIPDEYRQLVEAYYRALSENRSTTP
ncbi:DUF4175 family protein [Pseudohongiella spirulinae]|uniref:DUF4175 domain-containing protein n=1 Tax=Pseudohongiella spirulinae TaxID=1249552 RepID=A0A0S2KBJ7_9GAMM|nr:DUF4175 family protein [Pseudohongiella spirulinae]ALO45697.1 hypothetical protein PS2015_1032 [Pseudohongiella spirulinae]